LGLVARSGRVRMGGDVSDQKKTTDKAWRFIKVGKVDLALQLLYQPMQELKGRDLGKDDAELVSLYGYCTFMCLRKRKEGIALCKKAVQLDSLNPRHHFLLGKAYLGVGTRKMAWKVFEQGLQVRPGYRPIKDAMEQMGNRKKPVLSFLPRGNPINVALGRLRHRATKRH